MSYRQLFDGLHKIIQSSDAWIATSVPRGGLRIIQPSTVSDIWVKSYDRQHHADDLASWRAIQTGRPVRAADAWPEGLLQSPYFQHFLSRTPYRHVAIVPLKEPVLEGFPGILQIYRNSELGEFTDAEMHRLADAAAQFDQLIAERRAAHVKEKGQTAPSRPWVHKLETRQFIFTTPNDTPPGLDELDERVRQTVQADFKERAKHLGDQILFDTWYTPADSAGILWPFHVAMYPKYPALGGQAVAFYCLQPTVANWNEVRGTDVSADAEMARLMPSVQFMTEEFHHGPSLAQIARTVHLSPFHFHRRFTDLLGITPKHFLLLCQIRLAEDLLAAGDKPLNEIAKVCAFAHQSHFTSRFRQATGLTPTRWRSWAMRLAEKSKSR